MGHETEFDKYQLTWHIEDKSKHIHRLELDETTWFEEIDLETGLRTPELVRHGFWRFQIVPDEASSTVDIKDLECTIDKERFSSELARMRDLAWQQVWSWFPQFLKEDDSEG